MRPVLQNQPQIGNLGQFLLDALRNLVGTIQAGWNRQHNGDGGHTAITAESLAVTPGVSLFGKVRLDSVTYFDPATSASQHNIYATGLENVSWLRLVQQQSLGADLEITGISAVGREVGDTLLLTLTEPTSGGAVLLALENGNSTAENRFADLAGPASPFTLEPGRSVQLIYNYYVGAPSGPRIPRWFIVDQG
jgi:hypothetical protein